MSPVSSGPDNTDLDAFAESLDLVERVRPFADQTWTPSTEAPPTLHLEDVSAIPFLADIPGVEEYQHRARVRADNGDLYATVTPPDRRYDTYCLETLDIGQPEWTNAHTRHDPLAVAQACLEDRPFARLVEVVRAAGLPGNPSIHVDRGRLDTRWTAGSGERMPSVCDRLSPTGYLDRQR